MWLLQYSVDDRTVGPRRQQQVPGRRHGTRLSEQPSRGALFSPDKSRLVPSERKLAAASCRVRLADWIREASGGRLARFLDRARNGTGIVILVARLHGLYSTGQYVRCVCLHRFGRGSVWDVASTSSVMEGRAWGPKRHIPFPAKESQSQRYTMVALVLSYRTLLHHDVSTAASCSPWCVDSPHAGPRPGSNLRRA